MYVTREVDYGFNNPYVNPFVYYLYSMQLFGGVWYIVNHNTDEV